MFADISFLHVRSPKRRAYSVGKSKQNRSHRHKLEKNSSNAEAVGESISKRIANLRTNGLPGISRLIVLNVLLSLCAVPFLQLKVPLMRSWPRPSALQNDKHHGSDHWNEV